MLIGRHSRRELLSNMSLARHSRSTRNCSEFQKICFGSDPVEFNGFVITPTNIQPSDKHIGAIRGSPTPQNITDIRSWFGLINKYRTATPSATTWRLSASISSCRQRSIGMISCNKFLSNPRLPC